MGFVKLCGFVLLFAAVFQPLHAVQLGQTMSELVIESGAPTFEDHSKNAVQYRWDLWKMDIQFQQGKIASITYTKTDDLTQAEIAQLLKARSNGKTWKPFGSQGMTFKNWMRSEDYAAAVFDPKFPRSIRFFGGKYASQVPDVQSETLQTPSPAPKNRVNPNELASSVASEIGRQGSTASTGYGFGILALLAFVALIKVGVGKPLRKPPRVSRQRAVSKNPSPAFRASEFCDITPPPTVPQLPEYSKPNIESLTWEQFEMLTGEIYRRKGWEVELCAGTGPDGGVDLRLRKDGELKLVQCKHGKAYQVGGPAIREFFGVLTSENANRGIFITSGRFTRDALSFAAGKPIDMIDHQMIQALVAEVSEPGENLYAVKKWEQNFNLQANFTTPACPFCSTSMVSRTGRRSGNSFWGCVNYPSCRGQRKRRTDLQEV